MHSQSYEQVISSECWDGADRERFVAFISCGLYDPSSVGCCQNVVWCSAVSVKKADRITRDQLGVSCIDTEWKHTWNVAFLRMTRPRCCCRQKWKRYLPDRCMHCKDPLHVIHYLYPITWPSTFTIVACCGITTKYLVDTLSSSGWALLIQHAVWRG